MSDYENPKAVPKFYLRLNDDKTGREGKPVYDEMVEIRFAGDKYTVHVAPAHEKHQFVRDAMGGHRWISYAEQFPRHYEAFKKNQEQIGNGTPLEELPFLSTEKRSEMRRLNIHSAEALASLEGTALSQLGMHGRSYKAQAQQYLDRSGTQSEKELRNELAELRAKFEAMSADKSSADKEEKLSPFSTWTPDELRAFLKEYKEPDPHPQLGQKNLVKLCDAVNQRLARAAAGEPALA